MKSNPDIIRKYLSVAAATTYNEDYTPGNGEEIIITNIYINCCDSAYTSVRVIWDPAGDNTIITLSARDAQQALNCRFTGNGTKKLRLQMKNTDPSNSRTFGGVIQGVIE